MRPELSLCMQKKSRRRNRTKHKEDENGSCKETRIVSRWGDGVIVLESMLIRCPHENGRAVFSDFSTLRPGFKKVLFQDLCGRSAKTMQYMCVFAKEHSRLDGPLIPKVTKESPSSPPVSKRLRITAESESESPGVYSSRAGGSEQLHLRPPCITCPFVHSTQ